MNYQKAIAYLKNTIEFNDLEFGSVRQVSEVIKFLESKERAAAQNTSTNSAIVQCEYYKADGWTCAMKLRSHCGDSPCQLTLHNGA